MGPLLKAVLGGGPISQTIEKVVDRVVVDRNLNAKLKGELEAELAKAATDGALAQLDVNKVEAGNSSIFVAGWRPFIGWVCGSALAYQFVIGPVGVWIASFFLTDVPMPPLLDNMLWELMFGMLGMGALRTFEKWKGVAAK